jgi:iron complex outermembrane receptor protein
MHHRVLSVSAPVAVLTTASLTIAMIPCPSSAQGTDDSAQRAGALEEIMVTAQRRTERLQDVPLSVTVQTAEDLANAGIEDIRDLGIAVPGLNFNTQGAFAAPTIRGVQSTVAIAGADSPVAIYVDGVYQPNQLANVFDLVDIERIEVLSGPQGTLFGRNATAGAIVIHTLQPQYETAGKVSVDYGYYTGSGGSHSANDFRAGGYLTGPIIDDVLAYSVSASYTTMDGYLINDRTGGQTGEVDKYLLRGKLLWEPSDAMSFLLSGVYGDRDDYSAMAVQPLDGNSNSQFYADGVVSSEPWHVSTELKNGVDPTYVEQWGVSLKADFTLGDAGTLTSVTSYQDIKALITADIDAAYSPTCTAAFACILFDEDYPEKTFQQEIQFASEPIGNFSYLVGAFYYDDEHIEDNGIQPVLRADGSVDRSQSAALQFGATIFTEAYAGFGEVNYDVTDALHLIGGIRYSREKRHGEGDLTPYFPTTGEVVSDAWTPRFSVRYDINDGLNVYATYTEGFKSAVVDTIDQTDNIVKPEELSAYEIGMKAVGDRYRASAAVYYYDYTDLQLQFFDGTSTVLANAADAEIFGVEGDFAFDLSDNLTVRLVGAWLETAEYKDFPTGTAFALPNSPTGMAQAVVDASGDRMLKAPDFTGSITFTYAKDIAWGLLEASGNVYHSTEYWFDLLERVKNDGYTTLNAQIALTPANSGLRLGIFARNLTNEKYFTSALLGNQADAPVFSPPRQIGVSLEYSF